MCIVLLGISKSSMVFTCKNKTRYDHGTMSKMKQNKHCNSIVHFTFLFLSLIFPLVAYVFRFQSTMISEAAGKNQYGVPVEILLLRVAFPTTTNQAFNLAR